MRWIYSSILLVILSGCEPAISCGGDCHYSEKVGSAVVKSINKEECIVDLYSNQGIWGENIDAKCMRKMEIGKKYPAIYRVSTQINCKRYEIHVYYEIQER